MQQGFEALRERLRSFVAARDWEKYHSPKNLACALSVEAAELLEHFQWMPEEQSRTLPAEKIAAVESELADIQSYLIHIAEQMKIDLIAASFRKIELNESRYCWHSAKVDHLCALKIDQGWKPGAAAPGVFGL